MLRTILFFTVMWISLMISLLLLIPLIFMNLFNSHKTKNRYVWFLTSNWSKLVLFTSGIKVQYIPPVSFPEDPYVIVSNHQGYFDIPVILSALPVSPAFIAKKELKKIPFMNLWMEALECLFIDRSDSPGSRKKIMQRLHNKGLNPLLLFPEGTRSRGHTLKNFRTGGLKMVFDSKTNVLPVRISNTYKLWEESGNIKPGKVIVEVLPLIHSNDYEKNGFGDFLKIIRETLEMNNEDSL